MLFGGLELGSGIAINCKTGAVYVTDAALETLYVLDASGLSLPTDQCLVSQAVSSTPTFNFPQAPGSSNWVPGSLPDD